MCTDLVNYYRHIYNESTYMQAKYLWAKLSIVEASSVASSATVLLRQSLIKDLDASPPYTSLLKEVHIYRYVIFHGHITSVFSNSHSEGN